MGRTQAAELMGLRGAEDEREEKDTVSFRCPVSLINYVDSEAEASRRTATAVYVAALSLDRVLNARLAPVADRLEAYAREHGMSLRDELGEVIAALVHEALDARRRSKK